MSLEARLAGRRVQGEGGLMSLTGPDAEHPYRVGVPIADLLSGMYGAYGVLAALVSLAVVTTSLAPNVLLALF